MNPRMLFGIAALSTISLPAAADHPGIPQRDYMGRTYLIYTVQYSGPVWYAGDGRVVYGREKVYRNRVAGLPAPRQY